MNEYVILCTPPATVKPRAHRNMGSSRNKELQIVLNENVEEKRTKRGEETKERTTRKEELEKNGKKRTPPQQRKTKRDEQEQLQKNKNKIFRNRG